MTVDVEAILFGETPRKIGYASPKAGRWGKFYTDPGPGGARRWLLPEGEVTGPRFDYDRGVFTGILGGQQWDRPWTPDLTWHIASQIPGWCEPAQGQALYDLAAEGAALGGQVVELGSFKGLSSAWLGWGARSADRDAKVFCHDTFTGGRVGRWKVDVRPEFDANMTYAGLASYGGLPGTCITVQGVFARELAKWPGTPIGMLYIDGEHSYAQARADFEGWSRHCLPGALVAFDDCISDYPGILKLQQELAADPRLQLLGRVDAMVYWRLLSTGS